MEELSDNCVRETVKTRIHNSQHTLSHHAHQCPGQGPIHVDSRGHGPHGRAPQTAPRKPFGCQPSRTAMDSLHYVTKYMKDTWRCEVVSDLFLDIKSAFPSIVLNCLTHDIRQR